MSKTTKNKTSLVSLTQLIKDDKGATNIRLAIKEAKASAVDLQQSYQVIACSVINHLHDHGDIRVTRNLFENMPDSLNINSMKEFFHKYAPVTYDESGEVHYDKAVKFVFAECLENAWWKAKKQAPYMPFDLVAELDKLLKRASKKLEQPKEGDLVTDVQIKAMREVFYKIKPELNPTNQAPIDVLAIDEAV